MSNYNSLGAIAAAKMPIKRQESEITKRLIAEQSEGLGKMLRQIDETLSKTINDAQTEKVDQCKKNNSIETIVIGS